MVEDDALLGDALRTHVARAGHAVDLVDRIGDAELALKAVDYGLVLLDLNLPDGHGLKLLRQMRAAGDRRAVLILTARDKVSERIDGLNAGADDYLVKPFDLDELTARIDAVARRYAGSASSRLRIGELEIDMAGQLLRKQGRDVDLTAREWAVFKMLIARPGIIVPKDRIEEALYAFGAEIESNAVEVYVSRLRKKLGSNLIRTQRGLGYRLEVPA